MSKLSTIIIFSLLASFLNTGESKLRYVSNVQDACSVTRYQALCIRSLASFSNTAKKSPSKWARAGVSVTLADLKDVAQYLAQLKKSNFVKGRDGAALSDCVEVVSDAIDELHRSLGVLRRLSARNFEEQIGDLTTWLSATLTNEETCLDGFQEGGGGDGRRRRKEVEVVRKRVTNATYFASNALALVNKLATAGLG